MLAVQVGPIIMYGMGCSRSEEGAAQQAHEADLAVESFCVAAFAFAGVQVQFGHTAPAARRLMRGALAHSTDSK